MNTTLPAPVVVKPSGQWDGNDGKWSSFTINVGNWVPPDNGDSGQNFRVLISTDSPVLQVPRQSNWCNTADCAKRRGLEIFNEKQPFGLQIDHQNNGAWNSFGIYNFPLPYWWSGEQINGSWGLANVGLGPSSKDSLTLLEQTVVGTDAEELYMGSFGLAYLPVDAGGPRATFLDNLAYNNLTPSVSYGYTAGAHYHASKFMNIWGRLQPFAFSTLTNGADYFAVNNQRAFGSLVIGGYDSSRLVSGPRPSISMLPGNTTLVVNVRSVVYNVDTNQISFTADADPSEFQATIDSTLPYLWLPDNICNEFVKMFQLTYDNDMNMYTVNKSAHEYNLAQDASVTFTIGGTSKSSDTSSIKLPYAAFDLGADVLPNNATSYFPIKKSPNGIYVLGRAFLQEAYLIVDYERNNFTVVQARSPDPLPDPPPVVIIHSKDYKPPPPSGGKGGLSPGAVAGTVVGVVILLGLLGASAFFFWKRRRNTQDHLKQKAAPSEFDTTEAGDQVKHRRVSELDSEPPFSPKSSVGGYYDRDGKEIPPFPSVPEMESPPAVAELWSPGAESTEAATRRMSQSERADYFTKVNGRGIMRSSSTGQHTPGAPIAELPGDDGKFTVYGQHFEPMVSPVERPVVHNRSPSDTSITSNIAEVMTLPPPESKPSGMEQPETEDAEQETQLERRPSHTRGLSDTTNTTAISDLTPEERERTLSPEGQRRPLSE